MDAVALIGRFVLAAVFALAGVTKLLDRAGSIRSLVAFGLPEGLARPAGTMVHDVAAESGLAGVLLEPGRLSAAGIGPDESHFRRAVERVNPGLPDRAAA